MNPRMLHRPTLVMILAALLLTEPGMAELRGVTPDEAEDLLQQGVPLIDIRTPKEWQATGVIAGSRKQTFFDESGQYDTRRWLQDLKDVAAGTERPLVLVCRSGNRSGIVGRILSDELGFKRVYHLEKGIREWHAEGKPLVPAPCSGAC